MVVANVDDFHCIRALASSCQLLETIAIKIVYERKKRATVECFEYLERGILRGEHFSGWLESLKKKEDAVNMYRSLYLARVHKVIKRVATQHA